jgi:hypothetical protein
MNLLLDKKKIKNIRVCQIILNTINTIIFILFLLLKKVYANKIKHTLQKKYKKMDQAKKQ